MENNINVKELNILLKSDRSDIEMEVEEDLNCK